jgi:epoxyqueuosine reductase
MTIQNTKEAVHARAREMGFDAVGFTVPQLSSRVKKDFTTFIKRGLHGDMVWMAEKAAQRRDPASLLNGAKTVIVLGINYGATKPLLDDPLSGLHNRDRGNLSVYARGSDYHHVVKKRLKAFASWLCDTHSCDARVYVDTAPVLEKPLAAKRPWAGRASIPTWCPATTAPGSSSAR